MLSRALGVPKRAITIAVGAGSKQKLVDVEGLDADELAARLAQSKT